MDTATTELTNQQKMSQGLRELADFLDEHPDFKIREITINSYKTHREEFIACAQQLEPFEKSADEHYYSLTRMFGPIILNLYCDHSLVCTKRIVQKDVEEWDCPEHLLSGNGEKESVDATTRH